MTTATTITTQCSSCSQPSTPLGQLAPWATLHGFLSCATWPHGRPPKGSAELWVSHPFHASVGDSFWMLDGGDGSLDAAILQHCQLLRDLGPWTGSWPANHSNRPRRRLEVELLEQRPLAGLASTLPCAPLPASSDSLDGWLDDDHAIVQRTEAHDLIWFTIDVEGDVGVTLAIDPRVSPAAVVLRSNFSVCDEGVFDAGHAALAPVTLERLEARAARPYSEP